MASCTLDIENAMLDQTGNDFSYTAPYTVICDEDNPGPLRALQVGRANGPHPIPDAYDAYSLLGEADLGSFAQSFDVRLFDRTTPNVWSIKVGWKPMSNGGLPTSQQQANPVARPAWFTLEFWETSKVIAEAWNVDAITTTNGTRAADTLGPVQNSAWDLFDDPLVEEDREVVLVAHLNFADLTSVLDFHRTYNRTVNSDTWYGYTKHKAKFLNLELGEVRHESTFSYYPAKIRIALSDEEWYAKIVNRGYNFLEANGDRKPILIDGGPPTEPVLLAADGTKLAEGTVGNSISYRTRREVAYSGMGIGGS